MIELLKYLANNLEQEQLLEVVHIISKNPEMIDQDTYMEIVNEIEGFEIREISKGKYDKLNEFIKNQDKIEEAKKIKHALMVCKILKDNDISLN